MKRRNIKIRKQWVMQANSIWAQAQESSLLKLLEDRRRCLQLAITKIRSQSGFWMTMNLLEYSLSWYRLSRRVDPHNRRSLRSATPTLKMNLFRGVVEESSISGTWSLAKVHSCITQSQLRSKVIQHHWPHSPHFPTKTLDWQVGATTQTSSCGT